MCIAMKEKEAQGILQIWVDHVNSLGFAEHETLDMKELNETLDIIEGMLLIYNLFATNPIELFDDGTHTYSLEAIG